MISTNITPIESHPYPSPKLHIQFRDKYITHNLHKDTTTDPLHVHQTSSSSSRHLLQAGVNLTARCQAFFGGTVDDSSARAFVFNFSEIALGKLGALEGPGGLNENELIILLIGLSVNAAIEAGCDGSMVDLDALCVRFIQLVTDGDQNQACNATVNGLRTAADALRRRRLFAEGIAAEILKVSPGIQVAADLHDEWLFYFNGVYGVVYWDLTEAELSALSTGAAIELLPFLVLSDALVAAIDADCDADSANIGDVVQDSLANIRLVFGDTVSMTTTMIPDDNVDDEEEDDDESDSDSSSEENAARSDIRAQEDLDLDMKGLDGEEGGVIDDDYNGSEVVSLRIDTATIWNVVVVLMIFCGFNMSLCWFFIVGRKRSESVCDERDSLS